MARKHIELLHLSRYKKDFDSQVEWKGRVVGQNPASSTPEIKRHTSDTANDRISLTQINSNPVAGPADVPSLKKCKSVQIPSGR
mmetsp:Transcript_8622/g.14016  ORF Transcript_8622/g.14016 Transcript_8622/m.14016 type:complete len:84 (+) Transcript_8622:1517-1768(+)